MRVIAGKYKGHTLRGPRSAATRPTSDRVREAVFALLGDVEGTAVLDLFAGTGALAIEALSRGARKATLIERNRATLASISANLDATVRKDATLPEDCVRVVAGDVRRALEREARRCAEPGDRYDLVFIDPPYRAVEHAAPWLSELLPLVAKADGRIVVECAHREPLRFAFESQESAPEATERRYGDTLIRIVAPPCGANRDSV
jgi:16S rRNA (guanine966-N2)-methyltransferase